MINRAGTAARAELRALVAELSWRATLHALAGLCLSALTLLLLVVWQAAVVSLAEGGDPRPALMTIYVLTAVAVPPALILWVVALGHLQRARFRVVLGVEIPRPPRRSGGWRQRLAGTVRSAAAWRRLAYHLLSLVIGPAGGAAVLACWTVIPVAGTLAALDAGTVGGTRLLQAMFGVILLLSAPWVARGVARVDAAAARALLGPSRAEQLTQRVETLARSRAEVVAAADAERRRVERDLHDGAQQRLVSLAMNLGMALAEVPPEARGTIEYAHEETLGVIAELRQLVRGLHPAVLAERGLEAALSGVVARAPLPVRLEVDLPARCEPSIEAIAYFMVAESLTNIAKHARASRAEVTVRRAGGVLRVVVADDGRGGAGLAGPSGEGGSGSDGSGSGLRGLAQRAAAADGTLTIDSPPGGPTTITMELPCG